MKNSKLLYSLVLMCLMLYSCAHEQIDILEENAYIGIEENNNEKTVVSAVTYPQKSTNELIVEFSRGLKEAVKKQLRDKYGVIAYDKCDCTNDRIEKWEFSIGVDIEGRKGEIAQEGGVEGIDYQFYYENENTAATTLDSTIEEHHDELIQSFINTNEEAIVIAVLDTGINLSVLDESTPFLYQGEDETLCGVDGEEEISGWDFINNDNDVFDDNGHGTIVTGILKSRLEQDNITAYKILPVKIFDQRGKGSTFSILCGYLYAVRKPNMQIMNMSFGWYGTPSVLLDKFISENPDVLHLTSAGNHGYNNDNIAHYPSSIAYSHVLGIGSFYEKEIGGIAISSFSNYGKTSIDFLSLGEQVAFEDHNQQRYEVSGTSFAVPFVTSKAINYFLKGDRAPIAIMKQIYYNGTLLGDQNPLEVLYGDRVID
ncbi:S8 family serine peptidase [Aquimarina rhabdastrellae]